MYSQRSIVKNTRGWSGFIKGPYSCHLESMHTLGRRKSSRCKILRGAGTDQELCFHRSAMRRAPSRLWRSMSQRWEKSTVLTERAYRGSKPERLFLETLWKCQVYHWTWVSDSIINTEQPRNALTHKNSAMVWKWQCRVSNTFKPTVTLCNHNDVK